MILTIEKIRQFKLSWDADRRRRYLRKPGVNTFEDYLITLAHQPKRCHGCHHTDSLSCKGFINFGGASIKYDCTWCYDTIYVEHPANEKL